MIPEVKLFLILFLLGYINIIRFCRYSKKKIVAYLKVFLGSGIFAMVLLLFTFDLPVDLEGGIIYRLLYLGIIVFFLVNAFTVAISFMREGYWQLKALVENTAFGQGELQKLQEHAKRKTL